MMVNMFLYLTFTSYTTFLPLYARTLGMGNAGWLYSTYAIALLRHVLPVPELETSWPSTQLIALPGLSAVFVGCWFSRLLRMPKRFMQVWFMALIGLTPARSTRSLSIPYPSGAVSDELFSQGVNPAWTGEYHGLHCHSCWFPLSCICVEAYVSNRAGSLLAITAPQANPKLHQG
jgi:hypothetical protein